MAGRGIDRERRRDSCRSLAAVERVEPERERWERSRSDRLGVSVAQYSPISRPISPLKEFPMPGYEKAYHAAWLRGFCSFCSFFSLRYILCVIHKPGPNYAGQVQPISPRLLCPVIFRHFHLSTTYTILNTLVHASAIVSGIHFHPSFKPP
jgi:hypothetical protein